MTTPYRHILMLLDGSFNAEAAGRYALLVAEAGAAPLTLLAVSETRMATGSWDAMQASLERLADLGRSRGLTVQALHCQGEFLAQVAAAARELDCDVIMAAARHADAQNRFFVATAGSRLLAHLDTSVIIVRVVNPGHLARPHRILVPLRGGDTHWFGEKAYLVARLALACQAQVKILHVHRVKAAHPLHNSWLAPASLEAATREAVGGFEELLSAQGVAFASRAVAGPDITAAIVQEATARHHDLIIAGAPAGRASLLHPSPIEALMRQTPCDLLVLRPGR